MTDVNATAKNIQNLTRNAALISSVMPSIIMRADLTDAEAVQFKDIYPEWTIGQTYKQNWILRYNGELYRIGQPEITASETYKPGDVGTESIYSHIEISEEGYEVWKEWDGVSGIYQQDQIVHDPFDEGNLYKSKIPNNVWGPPHEQPDYWEKV